MSGIILCLASPAITSAANLQFITVTPSPQDPGNPTTATVAVNQTYQFTATGHYDDGSTQDLTTQVTWASVNPAVATIVSNSGLATGVAVGSTIITATVSTISGSANIKVAPGAKTTITLTSTVNPIPYGPPSLTTLVIKLAFSSGSPVGELVPFYDNGVNNLPSVSLDGSGSASLGYPPGGSSPGAGNHTLVAVYRGDANNAPSISNAVVETVNKATTSIGPCGGLSCNPNPSTSGQSVTCGVLVNAGSTGSVQISDGSTVIATSPPSGGGSCFGPTSGSGPTYSFNLSLGPGNHTLTAKYLGDANTLSSSSAPLTETVIFATSLLVTPSPSSLPNGGSVQFKAVATFSDSSTQDVTSAAGIAWSSSQPAIATISGAGLAASANAGTTVISASYQGVSGSSNLTVTPPPTTSHTTGGTNPVAMTAADFNQDGRLDLAIANENGGTTGTVGILLGNGGGIFSGPTTYSITGSLQGIASADFNNDGKPDLVISVTGNLYLMLGNGDGTFQNPVAIPQGALNDATHLVTGDFNNDGKPDIAAVTGASITILLGNGDGTFQTEQNFPASLGSCLVDTVAVGDINRDGNPDLVLGMQCGIVSILLGNGNGTFQSALLTGLASQDNFGLALGDLNTDGKLDLAVGTTNSGGISVMLGNGNGALQSPVSYGANNISAVAILDLNGDGKPDVVAADSLTKQLEVLFGNGDGTFLGPFDYAAGTRPVALSTGDFNRDGTDDIVSLNQIDGTISLTPGTATPNPNLSFRQTLNYNAGANPVAVAIGDFERNGNPDILVVNSGSNNVTLERSLGNHIGLFTPAATPIAVGTAPVAIAAADLNHDGILDFVTAYVGGVNVMLGDGAGNFSAALGSPVVFGPTVNSVAIGDLNHDGNPDLVTASGNVEVLLGKGDGTFVAPVVYNSGPSPVAQSVALADFDLDGNLDVAVANNTAGGNVAVLYGSANGTLSTAVATSLPANAQPVAIAVGDFNRDGKPDLAVADAANKSVTILLSTATPRFFSLGASYPVPFTPVNVAVGDFNHDGKPDIAVSNANQVSILIGNGDGTFQAPVSFNGGTNAAGLAVGDLNGDGKVDVAVANNNPSGTVSVLLNSSSGNLPSKTNFGAGTNPNSIATGDFNDLDDKLNPHSDLAIVNSGSNNITVQLGNGDGTFGSSQNIPVGTKPVAIAAGDLNNDGHLDLAVVNNGDSTVSILLGDGHGNFAGPSGGIPATLAVDPGPTSILMEDLNHDGNLDLAVSYGQTQTVSILFGNGDGSFQPPITYSAAPGRILDSAVRASAAAGGIVIGPRMIAKGDFNGDGFDDLAVVVPLGNTVSVLINDKTGHFPAANIKTYNVNTLPLGVAAGDFHGTGKADIAVLNTGSNNLTVLANDGTGNFPTHYDVATGGTPISITALDFNGDGKIDMAWVNSADNSVTLLPGKGDGTFDQNAAETVAAGTQPYDLVIGSFSGGGLNDLAVANNTSNNVSIILNLGSNAIHNVSSSNPAVYNSPIVFNTSISGTVAGTGIPKGTITYFDGTSVLGTANLNGAGQATFQVPVTLTVGTHAIRVSYSGDGFFVANSAVYNQMVQSASTATQLISSQSTITYGQGVTFTATVTSPAGGPTGNVVFCDGAVSSGACSGTTLATVALSGGLASFTTTTPLNVGTHNITALYAGAAPLFGASNAAVSEIVNQATTKTTLVSSNQNPLFGTPVIFTAQVTSSASATPTGNVTFSDNGSTIGTGALNSNGTATFPDSALAVGTTHSITASYPGDSNFSGSTSAAVTETVQKGTSALSLVSSGNPSVQGDSVIFTASLSPFAGTAGEMISFTADGSGLGSAALNSSGQAALPVSSLAVGFHKLHASYAGDANLSGSTSNEVDQFVLKKSATTLKSSPNPSNYGDLVTFTATVSSVSGGGTPTGSVTFYDGTTALGTPVNLDNSGNAPFSISTLSATTHLITAQYGGDLSFGPSTSTALSQLVNSTGNVALDVQHAAALTHVGEPLVFTATAADIGSSTPGVQFTALFTGPVIVKSATTTFGGPCIGTGPVLCQLGNMNPGDHASITITVVPLVTHDVTITVSSNTGAVPKNDTAKVRLRPFRQ